MGDKTEYEKKVRELMCKIWCGVCYNSGAINCTDCKKDQMGIYSQIEALVRTDERQKVVSEIREWIRILGEQSYASGVHAETAKVEILAELTDKLSAIEKEAGKQ